MLFNTYEFVLLFLPIMIISYYICYHFSKASCKYILLVGSFIFYMNFGLSFLYILLIVISFNYLISISMRKWKNYNLYLLFIGLIFNLCILGYFKYINFAISNINLFFNMNINSISIIAPIGISFYIFQQISFLVDSYRDESIKYHYLDYLTYSVLFMNIIQGPISYHSEIIPQLLNPQKNITNYTFRHNKKRENSFTKSALFDDKTTCLSTYTYENLSKGLAMFSMGLSKKILLADNFAIIADIGFGNIASLNTISAILCVLGYTFQIYFDFSGYSDMVLGMGKIFNIEFPLNFNSPYKAVSINDFWKRWHMSLTRFFTKYVYIPLGGNRKGKYRTYLNILIVFLISGFWHGAQYTFIIWGLIHGTLSVMERVFTNKIKSKTCKVFITFLLINLAWIFFRANGIQQAIMLINRIFSFQFNAIEPTMMHALTFPEFEILLQSLISENHRQLIYLAGIYLSAVGIVFKCRNTTEIVNDLAPTTRNAVFIALLLVWSIISFSGVSKFIYINF